ATTGSSTAPTRPSSSPRSARAWKRRCRWRCERLARFSGTARQDGVYCLLRGQAGRIEPAAGVAELLSLLRVEVRPALTHPLVTPLDITRQRDFQGWSKDDEKRPTGAEMAFVDAQTVLADDDVVDDDGESL